MSLYSDTRGFLDTCYRLSVVVAFVRWNRYCVVREILDPLSITRYFDYLFNKFYPFKYELLAISIDIIGRSLGVGRQLNVIYVSDRRDYMT